MKIITKTLLGLSLPALLLATGTSYAAASLQSVDAAVQASGRSTLRLQFDSKVEVPNSFVMQQPASIVLDFPNAVRGMKERSKELNSKSVKSVRIAGVEDKLRVMVALNKITKYTTNVQGNTVVLTFDDNQNNNAAQQQVAQQQRAQQQRAPQQRNELGNIDFRRTNNGGGQAIITLPHPSTVVETRKVGNSIVLSLKDVKAKEPSKRIDVLDFATPASYIDVFRRGRDVEIKLSANAAFTHDARKDGNNYIVTFNKVVAKKKINPLDVKKKVVYTGKKLSLNFQDIEVRSVLQLLADFTDKNIVVSDSVTGNITLRLKDVPWDQALAIVLESKGLAMRENGNVIWVALASELAAKEASELEAYQRKQVLEPLITEYFTVNYAKASEMAALINTSSEATSATANTPSNTPSSEKAYVTVDERTNTIIVRNTAARIAEMRELIESLDVQVKQVSVESRIVIASDDFNKELGAQFGVSGFGTTGDTSLVTSGTNASNTSMLNDINSGAAVNFDDDRLNVNLPADNAAGLAVSLLSGDFLLDLELSALQAENKGEIISTPRVVTADKQTARIEQGVEIPFQEASSSGATTVSFQKAVLSLEVTPQVTPDNNVIMDVQINQDSVGEVFEGIPSIDTREVQTQVLVGNGQTLVLGGVHEESTSTGVSKVPVLGDLPILGRLFRTDLDSDAKSELLIFVTPKIMN